jgi:selT/selW/selH-like putative selenoprotein
MQTSSGNSSSLKDARPPPAVRIEYCRAGNHERPALDLAAALREEFGIDAVLEPARDGAFEVWVDGRLVFSKRATWRFPELDEVFYHVRNRSS